MAGKRTSRKPAKPSSGLDRSSSVPLHEQLRQLLISELAQYSPDEKLPTEYEMAERFGVSRLTVHKVMSGLHHDGFVIRQPGRGTYVAPRDKQVHTHQELGRNGSLIVAYADWFSYDIWGKVEAAERLCVQHDLRLLNCKITRDAMYDAVEQLAQDLDDLRGLLIIPPGGQVEPESLALFERLALPTGLLTAADIETLPPTVFTVCQDFRQIGQMDIDLLAARGHRRIGYVASEPWFHGSKLQYQGMKDALYAHKLKLRDLLTPATTSRAWDDACHVAYEQTRQMLAEQPPTALIYDSMPTAMAGVRAVSELGLSQSMPDIVVNANYFGMEAYMWPPITVVSAELSTIVAAAIDRLLNPSPSADRQIVVPVSAQESSPGQSRPTLPGR